MMLLSDEYHVRLAAKDTHYYWGDDAEARKCNVTSDMRDLVSSTVDRASLSS